MLDILLVDFSYRLLALFLPILGFVGYRFRSICNYTRFSMLRESGHHLLYNSISHGFTTLLVVYAVYIMINLLIAEFHIFVFIAPDLVAMYLVVIFAIFVPHLLNFLIFRDEYRYIRRTMKSRGDSLYLLVFDSYKNKYSLKLTLKNGKEFIGSSPKPLGFRYEYVDIIPHGSSQQVSIKAEEILTAKQVVSFEEI